MPDPRSLLKYQKIAIGSYGRCLLSHAALPREKVSTVHCEISIRIRCYP